MKKTQHLEGAFFRKFGLFFYNHRILTVCFFVILTTLAGIVCKDLKMDVSIEGFLRHDDPVLTSYAQFRKDFGNDELIVVGIEGKQVFDLDFLRKLKDLHEELEKKIPYVDDITGLINVRNTRGKGDTLLVEDLFEHFPENQQELELIKERVVANSLYRNLVISEDMQTTAIVIRLLAFSPGIQRDALQGFDDPVGAESQSLKRLSVRESGLAVQATKAILEKYDSKGFKTRLSGTAAVDHFLITIIPADTKKFMCLAYLTVIILLALLFRRVSGIVIPVIIVSLTLVFTLSLFALFKVPIKLPTQTLPSFLLAVSVCYAVHVLALFYYKNKQDIGNKQALGKALSHAGKAILLTGITTAAGLLSFAGSKNAPIGELGLFASSGIFIAVLLTFTLLPALVSFIPETKAEKTLEKPQLLDVVLTNVARFSIQKAWWVVGMGIFLVILSAVGCSKIHFSHNTLEWLPEMAIIRQDTEQLDQSMKGTISMELVIDTHQENGLYDPDLLKQIDKVSQRIQHLSTDQVVTGKVWSLIEIVKETNQALHADDPLFYRIPDQRDLCAQELFLFSSSGSDDLEDFTDSTFSKVRISIKLPFVDAIAYHDYIKHVDVLLKRSFPDVSVTSTGLIIIYAQVIANTIQDMKASYLVAIAIVTLLMILLVGNIRMGLISMVPNLFPIIVVMGIAGFLSVPCSLFIMLIGNIVIGLAVDDTIHFMNNFTTYLKQGCSVSKSIEKTLLTTGRAMLITSLILSSAFFIYLFSSLNNLHDFGILAGIAVLLALISDFFLTPALLTVFYGRKIN